MPERRRAVSGEPAADAHDALRLWLRLFTTAATVERHLGSALKRRFGSSLPRFDLLAQLHRAPEGLGMTELSERLLVTGGNVTWLVRSLARDGYVVRERAPHDGRAAVVRLTPAGRRHFAAMARAHERWVEALLAPLSATARAALGTHLATLKRGVAHPPDLT